MVKYQHTYESNDDRQIRLNGSYCIWKDHVVYLEYSGGYEFRATYARSLKLTPEMIDIRNEAFNSVPFALGWVNSNRGGDTNNAYYLSRTANRSTRQGIVHRSVQCSDHRGNQVSVDNLRFDEALEDCLNNRYPSVSEAIKSLVNTKNNSVAISRTVMMNSDEIGIIKISFGQEVIGWYSRSEGFCRIPEENKFDWYCKFLSPFGLKAESGLEL